MEAASTEESMVKSFRDEAFDIKRSKNYHLSLQLGPDSLYSAVLDKSKNTYLTLEEHLFDNPANSLHQAIQSAASLFRDKALYNAEYDSVSLGLISPFSTLVPDAVYDKDKKEKFLSFNTQIDKGQLIVSDPVSNIATRNVYLLNENLKEKFASAFPGIKFYHFSTPLIESIVALASEEKKKQVFVHVQFGHFEVLVLKGKKLLYYNSFNYQTSEDFIYFLLFVMKQLEADRNKVSVKLLGEIKKKDSTYSLLYKYIKKPEFIGRLDNFEYSPALDAIPSHYYFNILSQYLCE